jgi:hypothetical protein
MRERRPLSLAPASTPHRPESREQLEDVLQNQQKATRAPTATARRRVADEKNFPTGGGCPTSSLFGTDSLPPGLLSR